MPIAFVHVHLIHPCLHTPCLAMAHVHLPCSEQAYSACTCSCTSTVACQQVPLPPPASQTKNGLLVLSPAAQKWVARALTSSAKMGCSCTHQQPCSCQLPRAYRLITLLEPARHASKHDLHTTLIRNEAAYYNCVRQLLQEAPPPAYGECALAHVVSAHLRMW